MHRENASSRAESGGGPLFKSYPRWSLRMLILLRREDVRSSRMYNRDYGINESGQSLGELVEVPASRTPTAWMKWNFQISDYIFISDSRRERWVDAKHSKNGNANLNTICSFDVERNTQTIQQNGSQDEINLSNLKNY